MVDQHDEIGGVGKAVRTVGDCAVEKTVVTAPRLG